MKVKCFSALYVGEVEEKKNEELVASIFFAKMIRIVSLEFRSFAVLNGRVKFRQGYERTGWLAGRLRRSRGCVTQRGAITADCLFESFHM